MQKKQNGTGRQMDLLTKMVTYRDANVVNNSLNTVYNSLNSQICASLPLNSLKTQKKQSGTDRPTARPTDRQTDRQTDIVTYRVACTRLKNQEKLPVQALKLLF